MTAHLAHAGLLELVGWAAVAFALAAALLTGAGATGRLLARRLRRPVLLRLARARRWWRGRRPAAAHRHRRPHPRAALAARITHHHIPGGTSR